MTAADYQNIKLAWKGPAAWVTLSRADKLNPLDWSTVKELRRALAEIDARKGVIAAVIIGSGRAFSAGGDLDAYVDLYKKPKEFQQFLDDFHALLNGIEASKRVFIAAVNGVCVAGGLELLLACDLVYASDTARIGDGHLNFGQLPGAGGSQRLPRAIGLARAKHLFFSGDLLPAVEAERVGLVNKVVPAAELDKAVTAFIEQMAAKSPVGLAKVKHLANITAAMNLTDGLKHEIGVVHNYATTDHDATEGLIAFNKKRKPNFSKG
jgi:enoyl-CoA hydratase/carnithine racemase